MDDPRHYYSTRTGKLSGAFTIDLDSASRLLNATYKVFRDRYFFQEAEGYYCVDTGIIIGTMGPDREVYAEMRIRKRGLYPIIETNSYSEDDLFDLIEFLYDHVSKPTKGREHTYNDCGWHYFEFDKKGGQDEFRKEINRFLNDYDKGWEINTAGEVASLSPGGLKSLVDMEIPECDPANIKARIENAKSLFLGRKSTSEDKRMAVRELADVMEFLRPKIHGVLTNRDESDLFQLINNFGIRHHRLDQKTQYDLDVWLDWMFYYYLVTVYSIIRLLSKKGIE